MTDTQKFKLKVLVQRLRDLAMTDRGLAMCGNQSVAETNARLETVDARNSKAESIFKEIEAMIG